MRRFYGLFLISAGISPPSALHSGCCVQSSNGCKTVLHVNTFIWISTCSQLQPTKMGETNGISWRYLIVTFDPQFVTQFQIPQL